MKIESHSVRDGGNCAVLYRWGMWRAAALIFVEPVRGTCLTTTTTVELVGGLDPQNNLCPSQLSSRREL